MGRRPPKEPMVRIRPRLRWTIPAATSWVMRRVPVQLMVMMSRISSSGVRVKGTGMSWDLPTLLIRTAMSRLSMRAFSLA